MSRTLTPSTDTRARAAFLSKLAETGQVLLASKAGKISRQTAYNWRKADPEFAKSWDEAIETAVGLLEDAAFKRALKATDPSDSLLMFMLKARRPEVYRDRSEVQLNASLEISDRLRKARERVDGGG